MMLIPICIVWCVARASTATSQPCSRESRESHGACLIPIVSSLLPALGWSMKWWHEYCDGGPEVSSPASPSNPITHSVISLPCRCWLLTRTYIVYVYMYTIYMAIYHHNLTKYNKYYCTRPYFLSPSFSLYSHNLTQLFVMLRPSNKIPVTSEFYHNADYEILILLYRNSTWK